MIVFNKIDYYFDKRMELKIGEKRIKFLEQTLRELGNFSKQKQIEVINYEHDKDPRNTIYEIRDDDNTSFKFYNFALSYGKDTRYSKNYYLKVKKENSLIEYTYDFHNLDLNLDFLDILRVIELKYDLAENRVIRLERKQNCHIKIAIEEDDKKYLIYISGDEKEKDKYLLEDFENMVLKAKSLEKLNIENFINIIENKNNLSSCCVYKDDKEVARVKFNKGEISEYSIIEENRTVNTTFYDSIKRKVERKQDDEVIKTEEEYKEVNEDFNLIQSEVKRLLKRI